MKFRFFMVLIVFLCSLVSSQTLTPGTGWTGATAIPPAVGNSGIAGYDANIVAHWDEVPFRDISSTENVGVLAYHINGIEKVSFSVNNGPWVDVTQKTLNPETGVVEYWVVINPSSFGSNVLAEVRAIVYPLTAGQPKVLQGTIPVDQDSSMIFNLNPPAKTILYASVSGNDGNNCLTIGTACQTITRAVNSAGSNLNGVEIRLGEGTWNLNSVSGVSTTNRWFTITSAENANPNNVLVSGRSPATPSSGTGFYTKHFKIFNLSLIGPPIDPGVESYLWLDKIKAYYLADVIPAGTYFPSQNPSGLCYPGEWYGGYGSSLREAYMTDSWINNSCSSSYGFTLIRNVHSEKTGWGWGGSYTTINYTVRNVVGSIPGGIDYHGDVFPRQNGDGIIYGGGTVSGGRLWTRGFVTIAGGPLQDIVLDKVFLDLDEPYMQGIPGGVYPGWVFSFCNNLQNLLVYDSTFIGASNWCGEGGGTVNTATLKNILFQDTTFNFLGNIQPGPLSQNTGQLISSPTVRYISSGSLICTNGATQSCPMQQGVCLNSVQTCTNNNWPGCNYNFISNYQSSETSCDGLDNDCDEVVDEGCSVENNSSSQSQVSSSSTSSSGGSSGSSGGSSGSGGSSSHNSGQTPILNSSNEVISSGENLGDNSNFSEEGSLEFAESGKISNLFWITLFGLISLIILVIFKSFNHLRKLKVSSQTWQTL